jgi:CheY-like chemotaxis protein
VDDNQEHGILVVEDDPAIRRLVTMVLQRQGYRLESACDGLEAVLKLGVSDYDVIVLDLMMPNLDGFSFLNTLALNQPERLRTVIVTSAASPAVIRERMHGGPFRLLPKPFDIHELIDTVKSCIEAQGRGEIEN